MSKKYLQNKVGKVIFLFVYVILACVLIFFIKPFYLASIVIVLIPPALLNFFWLKNSKVKILIFSSITALFFAPPVELISRLANSWDVQSVIPRPLGLIPVENMFFAFFNFFWVLSFYEYFVDKDKKEKISKRFKYLILIYCFFFTGVFSVYFYNRDLVTLNYFEIAVPILILPALLLFFKRTGLLRKTVLPTIFFALIFFAYEFVSLIIGSWWWPGEYFWTIRLAGHLFPLDDVIIWYLLSTPVLIGGYEFFMDDWQ